MNELPVLKIDGEVEVARQLSYDDLARIDAADQVVDVSRLDPKRQGDAVTLAGLLKLVRPLAGADYLGLHAAADDFHASIPLAAVIERGLLIYRVAGAPLSAKSGGPFRFYIPDHAACHTDEVDECANVKFVDHIQLTIGRGYDNRPLDEAEHAKLHEDQQE